MCFFSQCHYSTMIYPIPEERKEIRQPTKRKVKLWIEPVKFGTCSMTIIRAIQITCVAPRCYRRAQEEFKWHSFIQGYF